MSTPNPTPDLPPGMDGVASAGRARLSPMMRLTASHMLASHTQAAHVTIHAEADAGGLLAAHAHWRDAAGGVRVTMTHLIARLCAQALVEHPALNATLVGEEVFTWRDVNLGLATAMANGDLIVPVLKGADRMSVAQMAHAARELVDRTRAGRARLADLRGGTFTLSSIGMYPALRWTTPLLNIPQVAILATGAVHAVHTAHGLGHRMGLSLTFDHRALNGVTATRFVQRLADLIADPPDAVARPDSQTYAQTKGAD